MASVSRTAQFAKVHKVLKKSYKPVPVDSNRPVLEHLLLACCLEDAHYEAAEEVFAALSHMFFDWNEVRVTSIAELCEVMARLPDPRAAANRLKRVLQAVFEETYSFELEEHRKKNLGPTVKWLTKLDGTTNFTVAYVVQAALGGHSIPIDSGVLAALRIVDLVSDKDVRQGVVPGLERAIAKSKGIEFGSLVHQLGADFTANPYSPTIRKLLLQINPDCKDRLPKRRVRKAAKPRTAETAEAPPAEAADDKIVATADKSSPKPAKGSRSGKKSQAEQKPARETDAAAEKKPSAATRKRASAKAKEASAGTTSRKKKSTSQGLSKRKPR